MQFAFGAYDSDGKLISSQELFNHGKVTGNNCSIVKFGPKDYLNALTIAVDFYVPSINQITIIKRSTDPDAGVVFLNIGTKRSIGDRSVSTSLTDLELDDYKLFGLESWSVAGALTGFKIIKANFASYNTAKSALASAKLVGPDLLTAKNKAETDYTNIVATAITTE